MKKFLLYGAIFGLAACSGVPSDINDEKVFFAFDSAAISDEARDSLESQSLYLKKNPEALKKLENYSQELIKSSTETRFSKIKFTENEYQFYMNPVEWSKLPQYGKLNTFHIAENYVILSVFKENKDIKDLITYAKEYRKIKIYSTFNNEILAEFHFNEQKIKDLTEKYKKREIPAKEYWKSINQGYKFNEHPTLP